MCHDADAVPPVEHGPQPVARTGALSLRSADGGTLAAYLARPGRISGLGVVVLPDQRGLAPFYRRLAERLAEHGHTALSIDYYARTAGTHLQDREEHFPTIEHLTALSREQLQADIATACSHLHAPEGGDCLAIVPLGFCMGGRLAFLCAASRDVTAVIGFYGVPGIAGPYGPGPTQHAHELRAPILGLFGDADEGIPPSEIAAFEQALTAAGVEHEIVTYPGAPHGFFDVHHTEYAQASTDAWQRVLAFLNRHAPTLTTT